ncbi:MAG: hypothetical protein GXX84_08600 [Acidobacteria bacterium]|nr:hypothetical protein [Acidobacteriota bacterium]
MFSGRESNLRIYRRGSKELVELRIDPWPANEKGIHFKYLFDFESHKAYTHDLVNNTCSWMLYVSERAPVAYDPITSIDAQARAEMARAKEHSAGTEEVHGIAATVIETDSPEGAIRTWIAQKENYPVKMAIRNNGGVLTTLMEVTQVDFNPPAASLFVPPVGCSTQAQGEWSDTGMKAHADALVSVQVSASGSNQTALQQPTANADEMIDIMDVTTPSKATCSVLFRVVRADTMEPVPDGLQILLDDRDVSSEYRSGVLRISNAPENFSLRVDSNDGNGWSSDLSRQCYRPETVLLLSVSPDLFETRWYWVKSGKYAAAEE